MSYQYCDDDCCCGPQTNISFCVMTQNIFNSSRFPVRRGGRLFSVSHPLCMMYGIQCSFVLLSDCHTNDAHSSPRQTRVMETDVDYKKISSRQIQLKVIWICLCNWSIFIRVESWDYFFAISRAFVHFSLLNPSLQLSVCWAMTNALCASG